MEILIQILKTEENIDSQLESNKDIIFIKNESSGWDGEAVINYVVSLSPLIIGTLSTIIIQKIRARKHIKVIDNGIEIHGVSEGNINEILKTIYENKKKDGPKQPD